MTKKSVGIKAGSMENRIQTPEPYSGVRGLRHGSVPEAPQPLAHGPPGLHPAVGLRASAAAARRPCPHNAPVPGVPATLAPGARPAHDPLRLGPKGAGPRRRTPAACAAAGAERGPPHAPALSPPAEGRPPRPLISGGRETKAQAAARPSPAPDAAGNRPRCGRHRASQLRPRVGLGRANPAPSTAPPPPSSLTFGV